MKALHIRSSALSEKAQKLLTLYSYYGWKGHIVCVSLEKEYDRLVEKGEIDADI